MEKKESCNVWTRGCWRTMAFWTCLPTCEVEGRELKRTWWLLVRRQLKASAFGSVFELLGTLPACLEDNLERTKEDKEDKASYSAGGASTSARRH